MSRYRFTNNAKDILSHLVLEGQAVQLELPGIVGCSYRTVLREVGNMRAAGYVDHDVGLIRKRGKPRFVLHPTFFGVLEVLVKFEKDSETLSKIAERHRDIWVLFEEWDYIAANKDLLDLTLSAIKDWMTRNTLPNKGVGRVSLREDILPQCKHEIMAGLLWGGDPIMRTTDGLIFKPETLAYFKRNTIIKKHMNEAIERQAELYQMRLVIIEAWAKGKLMSKVLEEWRREWPKRASGGYY